MKNPASQAAIAMKADGVASPTSQAALTPLVDELMDLYVSWLEECAAVAASYENWRASERRDNQLAFSAYRAALDREEHAASTYQGLVERIAEVHSGSSALAPQPVPRSDRIRRAAPGGACAVLLESLADAARRAATEAATTTTTYTIISGSLAGAIFLGASVPFVLIGFVLLRVSLSIVRGARCVALGRLRWPTGLPRS